MATQLGKTVKSDPQNDESVNPRFQPTIAHISFIPFINS